MSHTCIKFNGENLENATAALFFGPPRTQLIYSMSADGMELCHKTKWGKPKHKKKIVKAGELLDTIPMNYMIQDKNPFYHKTFMPLEWDLARCYAETLAAGKFYGPTGSALHWPLHIGDSFTENFGSYRQMRLCTTDLTLKNVGKIWKPEWLTDDSVNFNLLFHAPMAFEATGWLSLKFCNQSTSLFGQEVNRVIDKQQLADSNYQLNFYLDNFPLPPEEFIELSQIDEYYNHRYEMKFFPEADIRIEVTRGGSGYYVCWEDSLMLGAKWAAIVDAVNGVAIGPIITL